MGGSFDRRLGVHDFWEPLQMGVSTCVGPYAKGHELSTNFLIIKHRGELFAKLPIWAMILLILVFWHIGLVLLIVSLFFGFTYQFQGEADMEAANRVMSKASDVAEKVKEEIKK